MIWIRTFPCVAIWSQRLSGRRKIRSSAKKAKVRLFFFENLNKWNMYGRVGNVSDSPFQKLAHKSEYK